MSAATSPRQTAVMKVKPNPLAWKKAMQLAKGDAKRIEVRDPEELVVHNHPR